MAKEEKEITETTEYRLEIEMSLRLIKVLTSPSPPTPAPGPLDMLGTGSYVITGQPITTRIKKGATLGSGSYEIAGQTIITSGSAIQQLASGEYVLTGQPITTLIKRGATLAAGAYALSGQSLATKITRHTTLASGSYVVTGQTIDTAETDAYFVPFPTTPEYHVTSSADSGAGTLRDVLAALDGDATGGVVIVEPAHIFLRRQINVENLSNVLIVGAVSGGSVAPVVNGSAFVIEDSENITIVNMRFYGGVLQWSTSGATAHDAASFRRIDGLHLHNNTFAFGFDGTIDCLDCTKFSFHNNMVLFGMENHGSDSKAMILQGTSLGAADAVVYNNFFSTHVSRPLLQDGKWLMSGNIHYNQVAPCYTLQRLATGTTTEVDFTGNRTQYGPASSSTGQVRCIRTHGFILCYEDGTNESYLENGTPETWNFELYPGGATTFGCDNYIQGSQINSWNTYGVPADELDLADVGPQVKNFFEQMAIDQYNTPATGRSAVILNPSEVHYDVELNQEIVGDPDFITLLAYNWDSGTATLTVPIEELKNYAQTADLGSGTFVNLTIEDKNGNIIFDMTCECGTDLRDGTSNGSSLLDGTNVAVGSIMVTGGELTFDMSPVAVGDRSEFRLRFTTSSTPAGKCIYDVLPA